MTGYRRPIGEVGRVWRQVVVDETGCWVWPGAVTGAGYPTARVNGRVVALHRLVLEARHGPLGDQVVHHLCANPRCLNPNHLVVMSNRAHTALHHRLRREAAA